jgi:hypothetical protein
MCLLLAAEIAEVPMPHIGAHSTCSDMSLGPCAPLPPGEQADSALAAEIRSDTDLIVISQIWRGLLLRSTN